MDMAKVKKRNLFCLCARLSDRASITFHGDLREALCLCPFPHKTWQTDLPPRWVWDTLSHPPRYTQPLHFKRTGDNSLKGQEIAPQSLMYSDGFTCKQQTACLSFAPTPSPKFSTLHMQLSKKHHTDTHTHSLSDLSFME